MNAKCSQVDSIIHSLCAGIKDYHKVQDSKEAGHIQDGQISSLNFPDDVCLTHFTENCEHKTDKKGTNIIVVFLSVIVIRLSESHLLHRSKTVIY